MNRNGPLIEARVTASVGLGKQIGTRLSELSRFVCDLTHSVRSRIGQDNAAPVESSAMTESAKKRVTVDVIILAVGAAILIVLSFAGAI